MKVTNIHIRKISQPISAIFHLLSTLSTQDDQIWPKEDWPAMKFNDGLKLNAHGGHGPIRYFIKRFDPNSLIEFEFTSPKNFNGIHRLDIKKENETSTILKHTIEMETKGAIATFKWLIAVRHLHDALIEDAFDKVENRFSSNPKKSEWTLWVRILRWILG